MSFESFTEYYSIYTVPHCIPTNFRWVLGYLKLVKCSVKPISIVISFNSLLKLILIKFEFQ